MRYNGWRLPNIVYVPEGDGMVMRELKIDGMLVVHYAEALENVESFALAANFDEIATH